MDDNYLDEDVLANVYTVLQGRLRWMRKFDTEIVDGVLITLVTLVHKKVAQSGVVHMCSNDMRDEIANGKTDIDPYVFNKVVLHKQANTLNNFAVFVVRNNHYIPLLGSYSEIENAAIVNDPYDSDNEPGPLKKARR